MREISSSLRRERQISLRSLRGLKIWSITCTIALVSQRPRITWNFWAPSLLTLMRKVSNFQGNSWLVIWSRSLRAQYTFRSLTLTSKRAVHLGQSESWSSVVISGNTLLLWRTWFNPRKSTGRLSMMRDSIRWSCWWIRYSRSTKTHSRGEQNSMFPSRQWCSDAK